MRHISVTVSVAVDHNGEQHRWNDTVLIRDDLLTGHGDTTREQDEAVRLISHPGFWEWYHETFGRRNFDRRVFGRKGRAQ